MIPALGTVVIYTLNAGDAQQINKRRGDARESRVAADESGVMVHAGNDVREGDEFPMVVTRRWTDDMHSAVNGQVLLDGNDTYWATSRTEGDGPGHFRLH